MAKSVDPQFGPFTALAQLRVEHPELPYLDWSVTASGFVHGAWFATDEDVRPLIEAYAVVLGGKPVPMPHSREGRRRQGFVLRAVWRDIHFDLWVSGPASALVEAVSR
jgi:hypothetical protein